MNPFFFGPSSHPLYGVYHPATKQLDRKEAILLCPPFGQEYMRSHRAYRQLALLLNKRGFPVFRFDYRGTGDSFGELEDSRISNWLEDIALATEELKQTAHVEKISVVGLRLGGLLACAASLKGLQFHRLVLWDTVISGKDYLDELTEEISKFPGSRSKFLDQQGTIQFNGFALNSQKISDLNNMDLCQQAPIADKVIQISSSENQREEKLKSLWKDKKNYEYQLTPAPGNWNFVDDFGGILLPHEIIQAIVSRFDSQGES